jgi:hypothetical protein
MLDLLSNILYENYNSVTVKKDLHEGGGHESTEFYADLQRSMDKWYHPNHI